MKKLAGFILLFTFFIQVVYSQQAIKLNEPDKSRGLKVMEALATRHSISTFQNKELNLQDISDLLWAANGISRPENGKRTAPSAQNSQDIDIYVALKGGVYLYDAKNNSLNLISEGDFRHLAKDKITPPCLIFLVADASKYKDGNDPAHIADMNKIDAGIVSQNISLFCTSIGLGTRPRAQMEQKELRKVLKLTNQQTLLLNHPVGYPQ